MLIEHTPINETVGPVVFIQRTVDRVRHQVVCVVALVFSSSLCSLCCACSICVSSTLMSMLLILQNVISASQRHVLIEVFAVISAEDTRAPALQILLDTTAIVSNILIYFINIIS